MKAAYVIDKDKGYKRITQMLLSGGKRANIKTGWFSGEQVASDGALVSEYAMFNEFGTKHIPARPFMRHAFDTNKDKYVTLMHRFWGMVTDGTMSFQGLLYRVGLEMRNDIVRSITAAKTWAKPLAPGTIRAKKSTSPLIDTGAMRNTVWFETTDRQGLKTVHKG